MIKQIIKRILSGIAAGGIATFIAVTILMIKDITISSTMMWFQMLGSFIVGIYFGLSSFVFENDNWSRLKQICIHFPLSVLVFFTVALPLGWIPFASWAVLASIVMFMFYYAISWCGFCLYYKFQARKLNDELNK
ncbi:MAG TPA: DUF3021 domain-containing protein [Bacillota bacterium]|nr:DUF3021 domain-containing protein [Bacillota bacterium]